MSVPAENIFREMYRDQMIMKYKSRGFMMRNTVLPPAKVDGKTLYFPVATPGKARLSKRGDTLVPMNSGRALVPVTTDKYEASEEIFTDDINKMAPNEQETALNDAAMALGQAHDAAIYGKFVAGSYGTTVGAGNAAWDLAKALTARTLLKQKTQNTADEMFCILPILAFAQMETFAQFSRSDYTGRYTLSEGVRARTWGGVNWIEGYDELFPVSGNDVTFYMWNRRSVASGDKSSNPETQQTIGDGISTTINYDYRKRCYVIDNTIDVGATILLPEGIVECHFDKSTAITLPTNP